MIRFNDLTKEELRFLKKTIVNYLNFSPALYSEKRVMTVDEMNSLSREDLAHDFFNRQSDIDKFKDLVDQEVIDHYELMDDIACYIDLKLPKALHFKTLKRKAIQEKSYYHKLVSQNPYIDITSVPGARFQYPENYDSENNILRAKERRAAQLTSVSESL